MRKVLFLIHTLRGGGAEKSLVQLVNSLDATKFDITVMTVLNTGKYIKELNSNIKYKYMFNAIIDNSTPEKMKIVDKFKRIKLWLYYNVYWKIVSTTYLHRKYIKEKYDVEISFLEGICAKIISSSTNKKSKKICWIHTDLTKNKNTKKYFNDIKEEQKCYNKFDNIVCISQNVKRCFLEELKAKDSKKMLVLYNPIDIKNIHKKSHIDYKRIHETIKLDNVKVICSIGRLESLKGYDKLLRVHKMLIDTGIYHKLIILGEGSQHANLQKYITDNHLQETATLTGFVNNPYPYIKLSDIYVCSSQYEGLSIAACEAMILGKPLVVTEGAGLRALLGDNNQHGIIVQESDQSMYDALANLLQDEVKMLNYAKESRNLVSTFELKRNIKKIEKLLK